MAKNLKEKESVAKKGRCSGNRKGWRWGFPLPIFPK